MHDHSFEFAGTDMFTSYGMRIRKKHDVLKPSLRERKIVIPSRSGAYDFGAKTYNERTILVECDTINTLTADDKREIAFLLSEKGEIRFWDDPDRYYIGRIYDAAEVEKVGGVGTYFPLTFICDPFAYAVDGGFGACMTFSSSEMRMTVNYGGTAETPGVLKIKNNNASRAVASVQIAVKREV